jgi:hypothetical protein
MSQTIKLNFEIPQGYYTQEELNNYIKKNISNLLNSGMGRCGPLWLPRRHASGESFIRISAPLGLPPGREPGPGTK